MSNSTSILPWLTTMANTGDNGIATAFDGTSIGAVQYNEQTHVLKGQLVQANFSVSHSEFMDRPLSKDYITQNLSKLLANELLEKNLLSFTKRQDVHTGTFHFMARGFLVPSGDVQLLRTLKYV